MLPVTSAREIGLFDGIFGDPLFLLLLSAFTIITLTKIESVLINIDALTLEFDGINDTWLIVNMKMKMGSLFMFSCFVWCCDLFVTCFEFVDATNSHQGCFIKYIFGRKKFEMIICGLYNVKICGEFHELCFK